MGSLVQCVRTVSLLLVLCVLVLIPSTQAVPGTSLEAALLRAYNDGVVNGKWSQLFGSLGLLRQAGCSGQAAAFEWPYPTKGTDLQVALSNGKFRCAYLANTVITNQLGVIINSTLNANGRPTGAIVDWFDYLATLIAAEYNTAFQIEWDVSFTSRDSIFQSVLSGAVDSACGRFEPAAVYQSAPAAETLSYLQCSTYLDLPLVWVRKNANVFSWSELVEKVVQEKWRVCATPEGPTYVCSGILNQYINQSKPGCSTTSSSTVAFNRLLANNGCDAVFGSNPSQSIINKNSLISFSNPAIAAQGSYLRSEDVSTQAPALLNLAVLAVPKIL